MRNMSERIHIDPMLEPIDGSIHVPGSKSFTNRAIILAMATDGASTLRNPLRSEDTRFGFEAARAIGCKVDDSPASVSISGLGRRRPVSGTEVCVGSAGTVARFLPCLLAFGEPGEWTLTASEQMSSRPMRGLLDALASTGDAVSSVDGSGRYPLRVRAGGLLPDTFVIDGSISSQYLSGVLLAAPLLGKPITVLTDGNVVQSEYVWMTLDCMTHFGAEVNAAGDLSWIAVSAVPYSPAEIEVEADASTSSYFAALPAVLGGSVELPNLVRRSRQPDIRFLEILELFGCTVIWNGETGVTVRRDPSRPLIGGHVLDLNDCSDVALTVAAVSVFADAPVEIRGVEHIRHHECDRISALTLALAAMGIGVDEHSDGWTIHPGCPSYAEVCTMDDHRVAMALSVVGLAASGVSLDHPDCVAKTCPQFYDLIGSLGADVRRDG